MARSKVLRTTKYKLAEIKETKPELFEEINTLFSEFERYKVALVEEHRKVAEAIADYDISRAMATKSIGKLLRKSGEAFPMVQVEPNVWVYRNKEGEVMFELAFTERDARNATRAQKAGLSREVQSEDGAELFESEEDNPGEDSPNGIGF